MKKNQALCDRRHFLRGVMQAGAMYGLGSLGLPKFFAPQTAIATTSDSITPLILLVYCSGGWDPTMVFDSKVGILNCAQEQGARNATSSVASTLSYVQHANRPAVKTFFDTYGANAAIVNGIHAGSMSSRQAAFNMLGTVPVKRYRPTDWLSFYASSVAPNLELPHVVINAPYLPGELSNIAVKLNSAMIEDYDPAHASSSSTLGSAQEEALAALRNTAFTTITSNNGGDSLDSEKLRALYYGQARDQILSTRLPSLLQTMGARPSQESDFLRYGKLAIQLFSKGYSQCVSLQAGKDQAWDSFKNHYSSQANLYQSLFSDLNSLMSYANAQGVLSRMTIVVMSEMGKSPTLNSLNGKGPWPFTSTLLWGAGIAGGAVAGVTDAALRGLPVDPIFNTTDSKEAVTLEMGHVIASLYTKMNIPVSLILPKYKPLSKIMQAAS